MFAIAFVLIDTGYGIDTPILLFNINSHFRHLNRQETEVSRSSRVQAISQARKARCPHWYTRAEIHEAVTLAGASV